MKKLLPAFISLVCILNAAAQTRTTRLIVRGDDMGYSHSGNEALIKCYKEGIERSIEVIVASPWFPEAVKMLEDNKGVDVGLHLALTSEWDNVKWRPLSDCASLKDSDGYFFPMVWPNKNYPGRAIKENKWTLKDVEKEFRAQIELALKKIPRISHISSHMGCTDLDESVKMIAKKLAKEYKIDIQPQDYGVVSIGYDGSHTTSQEKIQSFISMINKLEMGKMYLCVDPPGLDSPELRASHHIGYEGVAIDRQGVTDLFTNDKVKEAIDKKQVQLICYKDLLAK